jgi:hypothetical protein
LFIACAGLSAASWGSPFFSSSTTFFAAFFSSALTAPLTVLSAAFYPFFYESADAVDAVLFILIIIILRLQV